MNIYSQQRWQKALFIIPLFYLLILPSLPAIASDRAANYQLAQASDRAKGIPYNQVGIGGIALGMSEAQVRKILGKPRRTKNGYMAIAGNTRTLEYRGLKVDLLEDADGKGKFSVYQLEATTSRYATLQGVRVGDSVEKVFATYGKPQDFKDGDTGVSYPVDSESPTFFNLNFQNGKVKTIFCGDFLG